MTAMEIGNQATATTILTDLYQPWSQSPSPTVDLPKLWGALGVQSGPNGAIFHSSTPLTSIREAIPTPRP